MFACEDNSRTLPVNHGGILKQEPNSALMFACEDNSRTLPVNHGGILKQVHRCLLVKTTQELCQ